VVDDVKVVMANNRDKTLRKEFTEVMGSSQPYTMLVAG
jgi:hypothetical protein